MTQKQAHGVQDLVLWHLGLLFTRCGKTIMFISRGGELILVSPVSVSARPVLGNADIVPVTPLPPRQKFFNLDNV